LVKTKRAGLLKSIRPELDSLRSTSFFLSPTLDDTLLHAPEKWIRNCPDQRRMTVPETVPAARH
jgi:hypothetical protein